MRKVLRKVGKSLRDEGQVLIIQPAIEDPYVEVEIDGEIEFREVTDDRNFRCYLRATVEAIHLSVDEGIFELIHEKVIPDGDYLCNEYASVQEWEADRRTYSEDLDTLTAMSTKIQALAHNSQHKVFEYWKGYRVLLRKK